MIHVTKSRSYRKKTRKKNNQLPDKHETINQEDSGVIKNLKSVGANYGQVEHRDYFVNTLERGVVLDGGGSQEKAYGGGVRNGNKEIITSVLSYNHPGGESVFRYSLNGTEGTCNYPGGSVDPRYSPNGSIEPCNSVNASVQHCNSPCSAVKTLNCSSGDSNGPMYIVTSCSFSDICASSYKDTVWGQGDIKETLGELSLCAA